MNKMGEMKKVEKKYRMSTIIDGGVNLIFKNTS